MTQLKLLVGICFLGFNYGAKIETERYYHVESSDGSLVTIGGDNSNQIKVITEDNHGSDPRQAFWVGDGESHEIKPQEQNAWRSLMIAHDLKSNLIFQQTRGNIFSRRHQWWVLHDLEGNKWNVQNIRSGLCIATNGKNMQLVAAICDRSSANQTFIFKPITVRTQAIIN